MLHLLAVLVVALALAQGHQNVSTPGLPPTGPHVHPGLPPADAQPSSIIAEEPPDVTPAQPRSACNLTRDVVVAMNSFNPNITLPLFSRDAIVTVDDSKHDFTIRVRGRKRINAMLRANLLFFGLFGRSNFTIVRTPVDEPDRCRAMVMMSSEMLQKCPGAMNSSVYATLDVHTRNGLINAVNHTMDSAQHQLIDECVAKRLNHSNGSLRGNAE